MVVIRLYVRHGSLVLGVIRRKLCNGNVTIVGVCVKMSAFLHGCRRYKFRANVVNVV